MLKWFACTASLILTSALCACGPLVTPMPVRLDEKAQKDVTEGWNRAFTPVNRLDGQAILDALMLTQGYQVGVDRLDFHSEKECSAGVVVMEIHFDRRVPAHDEFLVRLQSRSGRVLRQERYGRSQVERTYHELFIDRQRLASRDPASLTEEERRRLEAYERRVVAIEGAFPEPKPPG